MAKNKNLMLLVGLGSIISLACGAAEASKLNIKNSDPERKVSVQVEPKKGALLGTSAQSVNFDLVAGESKDIEVTNKIIEGDTFSVKGQVTMPSLSKNQCTDLNINTDYDIIFTAETTGLKCTATAK